MVEQAPTRYPDSWKPKGAPAFDEPEPGPELQPLEMELAAAAMSDDEWTQFVARARGDR
jgi:hypothetical protein